MEPRDRGFLRGLLVVASVAATMALVRQYNPTPKNVDGVWAGSQGSVRVELTLVQKDKDVTGIATISLSSDATAVLSAKGILAAPNVTLTLTSDRGERLVFRGHLNGRESMTGTLAGPKWPSREFALARR